MKLAWQWRGKRSIQRLLLAAFPISVWAFVLLGGTDATATTPQVLGDTVILGYNDLGMHCMGNSFSELCILPPANTMRATVINRSGEHPEIITQGVTVSYSIPGNTTSVTKTNFWQYAEQLFGVHLAPDVGLFGNGLTGSLTRTADRDWIVEGVPITPVRDDGILDPYQLATLTVRVGSVVKATTRAVMPVSWEMNCNLCHTTRGITVETDILRKHDQLHGTNLENQKPVLCARCHADPALGAPGDPNIPNLSSAMHSSHATRWPKTMPKNMTRDQYANKCYFCHPGFKTQCERDMHRAGSSCIRCHGDMAAVGDPTRRPWVDLPKCGTCHSVANHEYEEPGKRYRDSRGHGGVKCEACHGSPHSLYPTIQPNDNVQSIALQGHAGKIDTCSVCHSTPPHDPFFHRRED